MGQVLLKFLFFLGFFFSLHYLSIAAPKNIQQHKLDSLYGVVRTMDASNEKANVLCQIASIYGQQEDYAEANKANFEALELYRTFNNQIKSCKVLLDIGMTYDKANQYDQAFKYSFESLELLEKIEESLDPDDYNFRRGLILMNIGVIYGQLENSEMSLEMLKKAKILLQDSKPLYLAICHENLGNAYMVTKEYDQALLYLNKALNYYHQHSDEVRVALIANTLNNIGNVHKETKDFPSALDYYQNALNLIESEDIYLSERIGLLSKMGDLYIAMNQFDLAERYLDSALQLSSGQGGKRYIADSYRSLVKLSEKRKNHEAAYKYLTMLKQVEDSIYEPEVLERITKIQKDYDFKVRESENKLKIQLLEQEKKAARYKLYIILSVGAILGLLGVLWYFKQRQKSELNQIALQRAESEKQQLADQVKFKNSQLTNYAMFIVQRNELLEKIKLEIEKLRHIKTGEKPDIKPLLTIVNQHLLSSNDRKDFDVRVETENQDFFYKLNKRFPDLSEKNKKLCSLLVLNLSSKEIATLMNISVGSVEKSRHRLRKKMNLPSESNLSDFLNSL